MDARAEYRPTEDEMRLSNEEVITSRRPYMIMEKIQLHDGRWETLFANVSLRHAMQELWVDGGWRSLTRGQGRIIVARNQHEGLFYYLMVDGKTGQPYWLRGSAIWKHRRHNSG